MAFELEAKTNSICVIDCCSASALPEHPEKVNTPKSKVAVSSHCIRVDFSHLFFSIFSMEFKDNKSTSETTVCKR